MDDNLQPKQATGMSVGVARDLSLAGLSVVSADGQQQQYLLPPTSLKALHDQIGQILAKNPSLGGATPPSTRLRCYSVGASPLKLVPASPNRAWMDDFPSRHAYRCLPMAIANTHGWELLSPCSFSMEWNGGVETSDITFRCLDDYPFLSSFAVSNFARGIATFHTGFVFRTDPGWNLMVTGPLNNPKPGAAPLSGVVETDWVPFTFTMNWHFTRSGTVTFKKDEPFCLVYPVPQKSLEEITPEIFNLTDEPALKHEFDAWESRRAEFMQRLDARDPVAIKEGWQRFYFKGERPDGAAPPSTHQIKLRLNMPADRRK